MITKHHVIETGIASGLVFEIRSPQTKDPVAKPNCKECPYINDCVVIIWIKRGVQQAYKEHFR